MALQRVLEPEVMDTESEARDYDSMDHSAVNQCFVSDLLNLCASPTNVLDLGTGTAQVPVALCQRHADCRVLATDLATHMLELARYNVELANLTDRIQLGHVDAKQLPYEDADFPLVMSNGIVHHIPDPSAMLGEAIRVTQPGGFLFFRDLLRPADNDTLIKLVETYVGEEGEHARQMFEDSLRAALSLNEVCELVSSFGFPTSTVQPTSDRHWTWATNRDSRSSQ